MSLISVMTVTILILGDNLEQLQSGLSRRSA